MSEPPDKSTSDGVSSLPLTGRTGRQFDVIVSPSCPWEYLCIVVLALRSLRLRLPGPGLRFVLPSGWSARLEESLYQAFRDGQAAGAEFTDARDEPAESMAWARAMPFAVRRRTGLFREDSLGPVLPARGPEELLRSLDVDVGSDPEIAAFLSNSAHLERWRNRYHGRRAFVIGNGPSLRGTDLRALAKEFTLGSNGLFLLDRTYYFRPTFYVVEDRLVAEDRQQEIQAYDGTVKFFPWDQRDRLRADAYLPLIRSYAPYPQFSEDISEVLFTGWSVTYLLLQLAYFAGARVVYLVGVDGTYPAPRPEQVDSVVVAEGPDTNHFDPEYFGPGKRYHQPQRARVEAAYECARNVYEAAGGCIWNATFGGELEVFPRVPLSGLVPEAVT